MVGYQINNKSSKVVGYQINIEKSTVFFYTNNILSDKNVKSLMLSDIVNWSVDKNLSFDSKVILDKMVAESAGFQS